MSNPSDLVPWSSCHPSREWPALRIVSTADVYTESPVQTRMLSALVAFLAVLLFLTTVGLAGSAPVQAGEIDAKALLALHQAAARAYQFSLPTPAAEPQPVIELQDEPVYTWTNPTRAGGQRGHVFVWLAGGRPEVVGTIFSHPENSRRVICHEFHSLSLQTLQVDRESATRATRWVPQAGITFTPITGAPAVAGTAAQRLVQLRQLADSFSAKSVDRQQQGESWVLRRLTRPLIRYQPGTKESLDGALYAFCTSAGTDPEIMLLIEARAAKDGWSWQFAAGRFSDLDLYLTRDDGEVWSSLRSSANVWDHNADHTFRFYRDRVVDELPESQP